MASVIANYSKVPLHPKKGEKAACKTYGFKMDINETWWGVWTRFIWQ
jgi:hypothetical protein